jgi:hypothetical protein
MINRDPTNDGLKSQMGRVAIYRDYPRFGLTIDVPPSRVESS